LFFAENFSIGIKLGEKRWGGHILDLGSISRDVTKNVEKMQKVKPLGLKMNH